MPAPPPEPTDVTRILSAAAAGEPRAAADLLPIIYNQLRAIAQQQMNDERRAHTLEATALVHEAYLRLIGPGDLAWSGRAHFFHAAAEAMRRILIDHARARGREKRGGPRPIASLETLGNVADLAKNQTPEEIFAFDDAFRRLEEHEPRFAAIVRLRFFAGLSIEHTARALDISERTVNNDWTYARAFLARELANPRSTGQHP